MRLGVVSDSCFPKHLGVQGRKIVMSSRLYSMHYIVIYRPDWAAEWNLSQKIKEGKRKKGTKSKKVSLGTPVNYEKVACFGWSWELAGQVGKAGYFIHLIISKQKVFWSFFIKLKCWLPTLSMVHTTIHEEWPIHNTCHQEPCMCGGI